jgi:hypothetical protein
MVFEIFYTAEELTKFRDDAVIEDQGCWSLYLDCYFTPYPQHALLTRLLEHKKLDYSYEIMKKTTLFSIFIALYSVGLAMANRTTKGEAGFEPEHREHPDVNFPKKGKIAQGIIRRTRLSSCVEDSNNLTLCLVHHFPNNVLRLRLYTKG